MWQLYLRDHGIAVISSYGRMRQALGGVEPIFVGRVHYVDYDTDAIDESSAVTPFLYKRNSFQHEREVRALISRHPLTGERDDDGHEILDLEQDSPLGLPIDADLSTLIAEVRVAPTAPGWFADTVLDVTRRYGLNVAVEQSVLGRSPFY